MLNACRFYLATTNCCYYQKDKKGCSSLIVVGTSLFLFSAAISHKWKFNES